ncbi:MAG: glycosyltransferase family protein [Rubricoccaceae bacterium]
MTPPAPRRSAPRSLAAGGRPLRVAFAVQGEGRGHLTQALALAEMLRARGHDVAHVLVGASPRRRVPDFFTAEIGAPVTAYASPNFVADATGRIRLGRTVAAGLRQAAALTPSLDTIGRVLDETEPDVIVNFFEGLMGAYALLRGPAEPIVAVGHQFMFYHPAYPFISGHPIQKAATMAYTRLAGAGAVTRLALSFYDPAPHPGLTATPPLLRRQIRRLDGRTHDGSLLVYLMEPRMAEQLVAWSRRRPDVPVHCFSDVPPRTEGAVTFHALSGTRFLEHMARARGVVCTAGFESISEAMWLGKPVLMVPVPGHFEQRCNAGDAAAVGAGLALGRLDLDAFMAYLDASEGLHPPRADAFREWTACASDIAVGAIEKAARVFPAHAGDGALSAPMPRLRAA